MVLQVPQIQNSARVPHSRAVQKHRFEPGSPRPSTSAMGSSPTCRISPGLSRRASAVREKITAEGLAGSTSHEIIISSKFRSNSKDWSRVQRLGIPPHSFNWRSDCWRWTEMCSNSMASPMRYKDPATATKDSCSVSASADSKESHSSTGAPGLDAWQTSARPCGSAVRSLCTGTSRMRLARGASNPHMRGQSLSLRIPRIRAGLCPEKWVSSAVASISAPAGLCAPSNKTLRPPERMTTCSRPAHCTCFRPIRMHSAGIGRIGWSTARVATATAAFLF